MRQEVLLPQLPLKPQLPKLLSKLSWKLPWLSVQRLQASLEPNVPSTWQCKLASRLEQQPPVGQESSDHNLKKKEKHLEKYSKLFYVIVWL